jgi:molecular chaperone GrpE
VFKQNGVEQFNPVGQKFDPNMHNALFEVPDGSKEAGTVAVVTKVNMSWAPHECSL